MSTLNQDYLLVLINNAIDNIDYPQTPRGLYDPIKYTMSAGGKRLRPLLCVASADALGAKAEDALPAACGIEMFHNFTLLHDDIMDHAEVRRGQPTVHVKWNENTAILSGDAMLTMATGLVASSNTGVMPQLLHLFNRTAMQIYEGQQLDVGFEKRTDVTESEYLEMIRLKTSVLLGCACRSGAIIAKACEDDQKAFYKFGECLGLAFQLRDDYLDTFGDSTLFGKSIGGDISVNKKTWLLINAISEDKTGKIAKALGGEWDTEQKIAEVTSVYKSLKLDIRLEERIAYYTGQAITALDNINMDVSSAQFFKALANKMLKRDN